MEREKAGLALAPKAPSTPIIAPMPPSKLILALITPLSTQYQPENQQQSQQKSYKIYEMSIIT